MTIEALLERLYLLQSQQRWQESKDLLETFLVDNPDEWLAQLFYVNTILNLGDKGKARALIGPLLEQQPDNPAVVRMGAIVELADNKPQAAERLARLLIEMDAENDDGYVVLAKAKLEQRNYDAAFKAVEQALSLAPENQEALNMRIYLSGFLNTGDTNATIEEALHNNPEDSSTIANHGYQLLREGKVGEALERLKYALSINPTNQLARYAMLEALKARFWPYRLYFKYQQSMARLSGGAGLGVVIGLWLLVQFLSRVGRENPDLEVFTSPLVFILVSLFLLTWIIDPIMNFYLLTNKYGRLLLDDDDKLMANLVGGSIGLSLVSLVGWFTLRHEFLLLLALAFLLLTIPLGSFLRPIKKSQRNLTTLATIGIAITGLGGILADLPGLLNVALFGLLGYQFLLNGIMAKEGGRTFGE